MTIEGGRRDRARQWAETTRPFRPERPTENDRKTQWKQARSARCRTRRRARQGMVMIQYAPVPRAIVFGVSHMIFRSHHIDHEAT